MEAQHIIGIALVAFIVGYYWIKRKVVIAIAQAKEQLFTSGSFIVAAVYLAFALMLVGGYAGGRLALGISPVAASQQQKK